MSADEIGIDTSLKIGYEAQLPVLVQILFLFVIGSLSSSKD
jgi:hypothetical protein